MRTVICPNCEGSGEIVVNTTNQFGYGPDPQCDDTVMCGECLGDGTVEDLIDDDDLVDDTLTISPETAARMNALTRDTGLLGRELEASFARVFGGGR